MTFHALSSLHVYEMYDKLTHLARALKEHGQAWCKNADSDPHASLGIHLRTPSLGGAKQRAQALYSFGWHLPSPAPYTGAATALLLNTPTNACTKKGTKGHRASVEGVKRPSSSASVTPAPSALVTKNAATPPSFQTHLPTPGPYCVNFI
ncbi:hypothetical protein M405DRAFT_891334 [Rhizopogon salebrosus TDB-379]|nr:hypothetical protein M405DRAFT_891334 [Rhizopogon salebrosus TDB-379]